jgi:hypothetical protein
VYQEQWSIENGYGELKQFQLSIGHAVVQSESERNLPEIWALLTAYNLIRMEMSQIAREAKVAPLRISFVMAMRLIQDELIWCSLGKTGNSPGETEKDAGKREAVYPAGKEKTSQRNDCSNLKNPVSRSLKTS